MNQPPNAEVEDVWVKCGLCDKVRQCARRPNQSEQEWIAYSTLMQRTFCRACEDDFARQNDECTETVTIPGGVSGCKLSYRHEGRCQPWEMLESLRAEILAKRAEAKRARVTSQPPNVLRSGGAPLPLRDASPESRRAVVQFTGDFREFVFAYLALDASIRRYGQRIEREGVVKLPRWAKSARDVIERYEQFEGWSKANAMLERGVAALWAAVDKEIEELTK